jgi:hypothetical protein
MHVFGENLTRPSVFSSESVYRLAVARAFTEVPDVVTGSAPVSGRGRGLGLGLGRLLGLKKPPPVTDEVTQGARISWDRYHGWEAPGRVVALARDGELLHTGEVLNGDVFVTTKHPKAAGITGPDLRPGGALEPMFRACVLYFSVEKWAELGFGTNEQDIVNARAFVNAMHTGGAL